MTTQELKALAKLIDLCRKKGITKFQDAHSSFELGLAPQKRTRKSKGELTESPAFTDEEWSMWSAGQLPSDS